MIPSRKASPSESYQWDKSQDQQDLLHPALWHDLIRRNPAYVRDFRIMPHSHTCTMPIT